MEAMCHPAAAPASDAPGKGGGAGRLHLATPEATGALAARLAPALRPGDVLLLEGPIGAGKTHFARCLITTLQTAAGDTPEDVPSPSFTLVQNYRAGALEICHADLYRLDGPAEAGELGLEAAFETSLCLVEWPDRLGEMAPTDALTLRFGFAETDEARTLELRADGPRATALARIADG